MGLNEQGVMVSEGRTEVTTSLLHESTSTYGYREIPHTDVTRVDVLEQLKANIKHIEDLNGRLGFLLKEVQSVLKKA